MISKIYIFEDPSLYDFNSDLIVIEENLRLKLKDNPDMEFTEDFADDTGFTYDVEHTEFIDGIMQQKDTRLPDATCGANYSTDINLNWGNGILTGTGIGGASVNTGLLDLTGSTKYVEYSATANANSSQQGCIRFEFYPNYTGLPISTLSFFSIHKQNGNVSNLIFLNHNTAGNIILSIYNSSSIGIIASVNLGKWNQILYQKYEFELNYDLTLGATRLFIDGIQFGSTQTGIGTRDSNIFLLKIGADYNGVNRINGFFDNLIFFSTVQHTANYTIGYTVENKIYLGDIITVPSFSYAGPGHILELTSLTTTEINVPHFCINNKAWNGTAWIDITPTYNNTNTSEIILENISSFPISDILIFKIIWNESNVKMSINELSIGYTSQIYSTLNPVVTFLEPFINQGINSFVENLIKVENDEVKYNISKNEIFYYHNGSEWIVSDGTYSQSNTAAEIEENKDTFNIHAIGMTSYIKMFVHSETGITTPIVRSFTVQYGINPPSKCLVYGYCYDETGLPLEGVIIKLKLDSAYFFYDTIFGNNSLSDISTETDINGYWDIEIMNSVKWVFTFIFKNGRRKSYVRSIPTNESVSFTSLA